jgi:hypothetical protein
LLKNTPFRRLGTSAALEESGVTDATASLELQSIQQQGVELTTGMCRKPNVRSHVGIGKQYRVEAAVNIHGGYLQLCSRNIPSKQLQTRPRISTRLRPPWRSHDHLQRFRLDRNFTIRWITSVQLLE